jgi:hypothetical protein
MADSDHRWHRDLASGQDTKSSRGGQADDPLAELARLIGQTVPMSREARSTAPASKAVSRELDEPAPGSYAAPDEEVEELANDRYSSRAQAQGGYDRDFASQYDAAGDQYESEHHSQGAEHAELPARSSHPDHYDYDQYGEEPYDEADDQGYSEDGEDPSTRRRGGFIFVAAVFALAVLGTAGAFAYWAVFGGTVLPSLPPIIKAEGGPTKIIPSAGNSQGGASRDANAGGTAAGERLVSREEQPVNVPPPASPAPRSVATVPVFPDPPAPGIARSAPAVFPPPNPVPLVQAGPGAPQSPAGRFEGFNVAPGTVPPGTNPGTGGDQTAAAPTMPAPAGSASPAPGPAAPTPKKVRTVSIRADQSTGSENAARPAGQQQSAKPPTDANGPLSIVPASSDTGSVTTAGRPRAAPAPRPAPPNKPAPSETASAAPAPVAAGGGYTVQVSSQQSEEEAQASFRSLQAKYPNLLGGRQPIVRRADLGAKGIYYRAMVGPFASSDEAGDLCTKLKAAGGSCIVQKN